MTVPSPLADPVKYASFLQWVHLSAQNDRGRRYGFNNLLRSDALHGDAWRHFSSSRTKSAPGVDGVSFRDFAAPGPSLTVQCVVDEIQRGQYNPSPLRRVRVPNNEKVRTLGVPTMQDRLVQCLLRPLFEPVVEAELGNGGSYAYRKGLGPVRALWDIRKAIEQAPDDAYIVRADIESFFDSIPLKRIKTLVARRFKGQALRVIVAQLDAWAKNRKKTRGLPQGAPLSPMLSNWFLAPVDQLFAERDGVGYFRYSDDILIVVRGGASRAKEILAELRKQLALLGLQLGGGNKTVVSPASTGIDFLGVNVRKMSNESAVLNLTEESVDKFNLKYADAITSPVSGRRAADSGALMSGARAWLNYYAGIGEDVAEDAAKTFERLFGQRPSRNCGETRVPEPVREPVRKGVVVQVPPVGQASLDNDIGKPGRASSANCYEVGAVVYRGMRIVVAQLDNVELGEVHERFVAEREYLGARLQDEQLRLRDVRPRRRRIRAARVAELGSQQAADRAIASEPEYCRLLEAEQRARERAREYNEELRPVHWGIEELRQEMHRRTLTAGLRPTRGLEHLLRRRPFSTGPSPYRF